MSGTVLTSYQKALYTTLSGDSALMALVSGIFDHVPEQAGVRYLVFTAAAAEEDDTAAVQFQRVRFVIRSYSAEGGRKKTDEISARLHALLHRQPMTLESGFETVWQRIARNSSRLLNDGRSWMGECEVAALVEITG